VAIIVTSGFFFALRTMSRLRVGSSTPRLNSRRLRSDLTSAIWATRSDDVPRPCCASAAMARDRTRARPPETHAYFGRRASMTHRSRLQVFELIREMGMT